MKRRAPLIVLANLTARPASKDLILSGEAVIKKLDGVDARHPTHLTTHADTATVQCTAYTYMAGASTWMSATSRRRPVAAGRNRPIAALHHKSKGLKWMRNPRRHTHITLT
ncbi:hypothetical protein WR25_23681 [Diploscapter pachys]|uniref:Uncharacterized protein n=1 Tax=Diploscapter pachys TaxID=2018661 RepID=A0A2A2KCT8_9BILA|nr:hypothetical protein WR25_23681 [Diploscapter pachys]